MEMMKPFRLDLYNNPSLATSKKRCAECHKNVVLHWYYRNSRGVGDGFSTVCRKCVSKQAKIRWAEKRRRGIR